MSLLDADAGERMIQARSAQPRRTEGEPESLAFSDIFAFNQGNISLLYVGRYLLERQANEDPLAGESATQPSTRSLLCGD